jgi:hypothetical protein
MLGIVAVLAGLPVVCEGGLDRERLCQDRLQAIKDLSAALRTVADRASAEAAMPKLEAPARRWLQVAPIFDKLHRAKDARLKTARKQYENSFAYAFDLLTAELRRLENDAELCKICNKNEAFNESFGQRSSLEGQLTKARNDVKTLVYAVVAYRVEHDGQFPGSLADLARVPVTGGPPYISKKRLVDPWGQPFVLERGTVNPKTIVLRIYSIGPPGSNQRIRSWD